MYIHNYTDYKFIFNDNTSHYTISYFNAMYIYVYIETMLDIAEKR